MRHVGAAAIALCVVGAAAGVGCGDDPICPSDLFVALQTSQVSLDTDAAAPGVQTDVRVRTSLAEGEQVTLEVFDADDSELATSIATVDASGLAVFEHVTVATPATRLRVSVSVFCGDASDELLIPVTVGPTCTLTFSPEPVAIPFYAPARVFNTLTDPDPATPGHQVTATVTTVPGSTIEVFQNSGAGEQSLGLFDTDATGTARIPHALVDGAHSFRAFCTRGDTAAVSAPVSVVVDLTRPTCAFIAPPPGTTITPAFDNNLDLSDGLQLLVTAEVTGADVEDEPTTLSVAPLGGAATAVSSTKIDSDGHAGGFVTLDVPSSPAAFTFELTARDHAQNTCVASEDYNVVLDGCDLVVTSPTAPVTVDAAPGITGSQVDVGLQVSAACIGRTVTSTCGDDPSGVVAADGTLTLRPTLCATSPCETSELCTFTVSTADGVITSTSATLVFDDQGPATTVSIVSPAIACGAVITPASDADPGTDGVQLVARVTSPGADLRSLQITHGGTTTVDATNDVVLTLAPGTTSLVGIGADALGNLGASATCNVSLADLTVSFAAPAADGLLARADGTITAGGLAFTLCGSVSSTGTAVAITVDGGPPLPATVTGTTWCRDLVLAESPPSHTITATATAGASSGFASLVLRVDLTAPPVIDNFVAVAVDRRSLLATFDSPSDAGAPVDSYVAKISTTPLTDANFDSTGTLLAAPAPAAPGTAQSITFAPAQLQFGYFLGIATFDAAGNRSVASIAGPISPFLDRSGAITPPDPSLGQLRFGTAIAYGRFNDDDIDDLAISAPTQNAPGAASAGAVYIYFGSSLGIGLIPDVTITSTVANGRFGAGLTAVRWSSATRDDLVVGAPGLATHGELDLFRGGTLTAGTRDAATADARITASLAAPGAFAGGGLGSWLVTADVDGEGTPDLVAALPTGDAGNGGAVIVYGDTFPASGDVVLSDADASGANGAIAELVLDPTASGRRLGSYLHAVGPTLGVLDATDDLVLGYADDATTVDRLFVLRGDGTRPATPGVAVRAFTPGRDVRLDYATTSTATELGAQVTTIDDRDGDGARDLVISAHAHNNNRGQVIVVSGATMGTGGVASTADAGVTLTTINGGSAMRLGAIVLARSEVGSDIDLDGTEDLLVLARVGPSNRGFLWYGTALPSGVTTTASASFSFAAPATFKIGQVNRTGALGLARWVGDLDDDGLEDICWASRVDPADDGSFEVFD